MAKIKFNEAALRKMFDQTALEAEKAVARVVKSHAGRPVNEVKRALERELKKVNVDPGKDLSKIAKQISEIDPDE